MGLGASYQQPPPLYEDIHGARAARAVDIPIMPRPEKKAAKRAGGLIPRHLSSPNTTFPFLPPSTLAILSNW